MLQKSKGLNKMTLYLGYGGLIPFLALAVASILGNGKLINNGISLELWLLVYAATILSFLGAIHWGVVIALNDKLNTKEANTLLIYSVLPALSAWLCFLLSVKSALFLLSFLILLSYIIDSMFLFKIIKSHVSSKLASEFRKLRLHLTITVSFLLFVTALNLM